MSFTELAADVAMAGMDPLRFLESDDPTEVLIMIGVMKKWFKRREELDRSLAADIINNLAKSMGKRGATGAY